MASKKQDVLHQVQGASVESIADLVVHSKCLNCLNVPDGTIQTEEDELINTINAELNEMFNDQTCEVVFLDENAEHFEGVEIFIE